MPTLAEIQRGFLAAVLADDDAAIEGSIVADRLGAAARLRIYRNNASTSLREALRAVYPAVARLVGDGFFAYLAHEYVRAHPSRSGNLHDFGAAMPEFLANFAPAATLPYLPDVARIEWARHRAYHAAQATPFPLTRLAALAPERHVAVVLRLAPAASIVASPWPAVRIWEANQDDHEGEDTIALDGGPERALVTRADGSPVVRRLRPGEHALLAALAEGHVLADALEATLDAEPGADPAETLRFHVAEGTFVDFDLGADPRT